MAASAVIPFVSIEEYLHHFPEPDMDYVDGVLEERNLGEIDHSDLQGELTAIFRNHREAWNISTFPETRVQVAETRYRIPDVCVMPHTWKRTQIVHQAPLLCIEVKSAGFTLKRELTRAQDYIRMGVSEVWIFDPETRTACVLRQHGVSEHREGKLTLAGTSIELHLSDLFAVLDR